MPSNSLERMGEIMHVLHGDIQRAMELYTTEHSPYARRTYIRTFFAMIDGLTFQLKQVALERESEGSELFRHCLLTMVAAAAVSISPRHPEH
jgi:hypothetical protein